MQVEDLPLVPDEFRHDYAGLCWWCGARADSREHKWKKSEVVRLFGTGSYGDSVQWVHSHGVEAVRGPKAAALMFSPTLCGNCNGTRSQPFDDAYALFSNYLIDHHDDLLAAQSLDFADVYGEAMPVQLPLLARYYAKHIGCRIAEKAGRVPDDLVEFLDLARNTVPSVFSQLGVRLVLLDFVDENGARVMGLSLRGSVADYDPVPGGGLRSFKSGLGVGAIEFVFDVNLDPDRPNAGSGIFEDSVQVLWPHGEDLYSLQMMVKR
ncbi:hypothetical protein RL72_03807 [Microbacterium azadirachtae]|uniref:Uncharacterized protein n=1 Tax=Microbacterium azadirachtae TaxID=582680 RepID=A0A0F0K9G5_9MICO|nr:hypothetical protein [Microbacterium azadirachtae]KJL17558.1 hypothetical protein RL72_03807 [Microbacterium azadirachtae]